MSTYIEGPPSEDGQYAVIHAGARGIQVASVAGGHMTIDGLPARLEDIRGHLRLPPELELQISTDIKIFHLNNLLSRLRQLRDDIAARDEARAVLRDVEPRISQNATCFEAALRELFLRP